MPPYMLYLYDVFVRQWFVGLVVFGIFEKHFVHVSASILVQFVARTEDYEGDLAVAQHAQLVRFLHDAELALVERNLQR